MNIEIPLHNINESCGMSPGLKKSNANSLRRLSPYVLHQTSDRHFVTHTCSKLPSRLSQTPSTMKVLLRKTKLQKSSHKRHSEGKFWRTFRLDHYHSADCRDKCNLTRALSKTLTFHCISNTIQFPQAMLIELNKPCPWQSIHVNYLYLLPKIHWKPLKESKKQNPFIDFDLRTGILISRHGKNSNSVRVWLYILFTTIWYIKGFPPTLLRFFTRIQIALHLESANLIDKPQYFCPWPVEIDQETIYQWIRETP